MKSLLDYKTSRLILWCLAALAVIHCPQRFSNTKPKAPVLESAFPPELYYASQDSIKSSLRCYPQQIHVAQRSNVGSDGFVNMTISFLLDYNDCTNVRPHVLILREGQVIDKVASNQSLQFNYTSYKSNGMYQSDWIYHVELMNLEAGLKTVQYRIEIEEEFAVTNVQRRQLRAESTVVAATPTLTFRTPPLPRAPTRIALVGDLGQTYNSTLTMMHIWRNTLESNLNPHVVSHLLIAGDMSYADSDPHRWSSWFRIMEPLLRSTPVSVAVGNHEIECDTQTLQVFGAYENYFYNPNRVQDAVRKPISGKYRKTLWRHFCSTPSQFTAKYNYGNAFYSFRHGLVQMIVLSSYSETNVGSPQYEWLKRELKTLNRTETPWLVVSFHSPLYTTFLGHVNEAQAMRMKEAMEPLFLQHGVNLVVSGHDHAYMRTHSLANGAVDPTGKSPYYLTLGAAGNREHHSAGYRHSSPEPWVAMRTLIDYGYGDLFVQNATHARFTWVRDFTDTSNGDLHDSVWFYNPHASGL
jgi:hypothetical protein